MLMRIISDDDSQMMRIISDDDDSQMTIFSDDPGERGSGGEAEPE